MENQQQKDTYIGVSQWQQSGKKYRYWQFFRDRILVEVEKKITIVEGIRKIAGKDTEEERKISLEDLKNIIDNV